MKVRQSLGVTMRYASLGSSFTITILWLNVYKKGKVAAKLKKIKLTILLMNGEIA